MYDEYPPTLGELESASFTFPVDFPVVNNANSPDATKTLRAVIEHAITEKYFYHHIFTHDLERFKRSIGSRLYNKMAQHQYWIDEYLNLISDGQFFYNEEWNDGGHTTASTNVLSGTKTDAETKARTANSTSNGTSKKSSTPQNNITDLDDYLTSADVVSGADGGTESESNGLTQAETESRTASSAYGTNLHIKKSTLGDITVQFNNFANFPDFLESLIDIVQPCFITFYNDDIEL